VLCECSAQPASTCVEINCGTIYMYSSSEKKYVLLHRANFSFCVAYNTAAGTISYDRIDTHETMETAIRNPFFGERI